jgi:MoaA/NifB/PqqE/SkfB family radical SAM enzyme
MANISITTECNRRCKYCFAEDSQSDTAVKVMSREIFLAAIEYLKRSKIRQVRLLGGEPTLHPDFIWMIDLAEREGFKLMIFSNGLINNHIIKRLKHIEPENLTILLNTIHPLENNSIGMKKQQNTMNELGKRVMLGVNIYRREMDMDYLLDYVTKFDLKREIRIGISHTVLNSNNVFLHPKFYQQVGLDILDFIKKSKEQNILIGFDCGFVPCMFPRKSFDFLGDMLKKTGVCCSPNLDLLPDGNFISCYPLHFMKRIPLTEKIDAPYLIDEFKKLRDQLKKIGIYSYCVGCPLFANRCNGGCVAFRFHMLHAKPYNQINSNPG